MKIIKRFLVFFVTLIFSFPPGTSQANDLQEIFDRNWNYSALQIRTDNQATVHTKIFKRQIWINQIPITIADSNFIFLENPVTDHDSSKNDISRIAQEIKKSFGPDMKVSGTLNHLTVEGPFEKINRYIKISLKKDNSKFYIISSFIRLGFYHNVTNEVEELHSTLLSYHGKRAKEEKTSWNINFKIIEEARAQQTALDLLTLINGQNENQNSSINQLQFPGTEITGLTELNENVKEIGTSITQANTTLGNLTTQTELANTNWAKTNETAARLAEEAGNANRNWSSSNEEIGRANNNWANTNKELTRANESAEKFADEASRANTNWANTNKEITRANDSAEKFAEEARGVNTNWAESNKTLAKTLDPNHMAKLAFYTAAGAALGGVSVNLAIQGVSEGISFLHELFTGEKQKKLEWSDFEKAMATWDTQLNDLVKMEQIVDNFLGAFEFLDGKKMGNDYVKQLTFAIREMKFDKEGFLEKSRNQNLDLNCRKTYFHSAEELDQKIKEYENIISFLKKSNFKSDDNSEKFFCGQLKQLQKKILDAETQMQDLRLKILVAENQFYKKQREAINNRDEDIEKSNKKLAKTIKEKKKYQQQIEQRIKHNQTLSRNIWLSNCMKGQNEEGREIKKEFSKVFFLFSYFKRKNRCKEEFQKVADRVYGVDDLNKRRVTAEEELRKYLELRANSSVELKQSQEQISWMSKIHMDAYCYQFAHKSLPLPKKCSEFPETLYSLSLSRGYNKASEAYKNKCEARYVSGLEKLATYR